MVSCKSVLVFTALLATILLLSVELTGARELAQQTQEKMNKVVGEEKTFGLVGGFRPGIDRGFRPGFGSGFRPGFGSGFRPGFGFPGYGGGGGGYQGYYPGYGGGFPGYGPGYFGNP
ncbi:hypothetical protein J5N97_026303 [Dioscorea zingiberensis]|uniref:Glycine-rich protein n=1 Tax=Dioscorea zingiberensis TaxID=325984 RepID=A0A9D5C257_9LILI|nr:hypothetical protein J5N97_026303 [Dioscorea zingiberensis]